MSLDAEAEREAREAAYIRWLRENGAVFEKVLWPTVATASGSRGAVALDDIEAMEPIITIPERLMMTPPQAEQLPDIGHVFRENPSLLRNDAALALYFMHESLKGEASFYAPFLAILPEPYTVGDWPEKALDALQDPALVRQARGAARQRRSQYDRTFAALELQYPGLFLTERYTFKLYSAAWGTIEARAFGRRLPWSALVPFADCFNHANIATKYELRDGVFRMFTTGGQRFPLGSEIFISYGRRPNDNLLTDYGFAMLDNVWDEVEVPALLSLPAAGAKTDLTAESATTDKKKLLYPGVGAEACESATSGSYGGANGTRGASNETVKATLFAEEAPAQSRGGGRVATKGLVVECQRALLLSQGFHNKRSFVVTRDELCEDLLRFSRIAALSEEDALLLSAVGDDIAEAATAGTTADAARARQAAAARTAGPAGADASISAATSAVATAPAEAAQLEHRWPPGCINAAWMRLVAGSAGEGVLTVPWEGPLSLHNEAAAWRLVAAALARRLALYPTSLLKDEAELRRREDFALAEEEDGKEKEDSEAAAAAASTPAMAAEEMLHALRYRITAKRLLRQQIACARAMWTFIAALQATGPHPTVAGEPVAADPYQALEDSFNGRVPQAFLRYLMSLEARAEKGSAVAAAAAASARAGKPAAGESVAAEAARGCRPWMNAPITSAASVEEVRW